MKTRNPRMLALPRLTPLVLALTLTGLMVPMIQGTAQHAHAEKYQSRLGQLIQQKPTLYLPTRLVMGEENKFVFKAKAGSKVKLFLSPKAEGMMLENGTALRVGEDSEALEGVVPENGVLTLTLPIPNEPEWEGKLLYVDAVVSTDETYSAAPSVIEFVDATGRRTEANALVLAKPAERGGPMIMPSMPGLNPQLFNQVTSMSEIYTNPDDPRKKLLDDGKRNTDVLYDQNSLMNRPGSVLPGVR